MNLHIVETESQFLELRNSWNRLNCEPLLSWDWHYWWWKYLGQDDDLQIMVGQRNGDVCGIAPFRIETGRGKRCLRFLGSGSACTDYIDLIAKPDAKIEFAKAVADRIMDEEEGRFSLVELEGVVDSQDSLLLCDQLKDSFWRYDRDLDSTWVIQLPQSWNEFVSARKKYLRRKIRKAEKRFQSGQAVVDSTRDGIGFEEAFDILVDLHQQRFVAKGEPGVFSNPSFELFLKNATHSLCQRDKAEIVVCKADDKPVVAHLYLIGNTGPQMYQSGICSQSMHLEPGHLLFTHLVQRAISEGCSTFDFLRGNEHYKSVWGGEPTPLHTVRCVSKRLSSTLTHQVIRGLRQLKNIKDSLSTQPLLLRHKETTA